MANRSHGKNDNELRSEINTGSRVRNAASSGAATFTSPSAKLLAIDERSNFLKIAGTR